MSWLKRLYQEWREWRFAAKLSSIYMLVFCGLALVLLATGTLTDFKRPEVVRWWSGAAISAIFILVLVLISRIRIKRKTPAPQREGMTVNRSPYP